MLVFISWSGQKSHYVAQALHSWLKDTMQVLEPWLSSEDIRQGARWNVDVARKLEEATFGILCLTRDNLSEPWVLFEAGALAKTLDQSLVCPYLIDLKPSELKGPLVQFHAAQATESDTRKLLHSMNKQLGKNALPDAQVDRACRKWWPDLEIVLRQLPEPTTPLEELRSDRELIEELLDRVRRIDTSTELSVSSPSGLEFAHAFPRSLFEGPDVTKLLTKVDESDADTDPNAAIWSTSHVDFPRHVLDGLWSTRWGGGTAPCKWITGIARVQVYGDSLYAVTHDGRADCLIVVKQIGSGRLAGRYINLDAPSEVLPWVGRVVHKDRIDGFWTQGRWDLRRGATRGQ